MEEKKQKAEEKVKLTVEIQPQLAKLIDEASRKHGDCGRAVVVRMALYSFFDVKD